MKLAPTPRRRLMAGNWKMNLNHLEAIAHVQKLAFSLTDKELTDIEVSVLTPFTDLRSVQTLIDGDKYKITYGSQNVSQWELGAYTGDISASMLARLGCHYAIVGHSERRQYHGETDEVVNLKARRAVANGVTPIICVGEKLVVREAGDHVQHALDSVRACTDGFTNQQIAAMVIAYEPVWAIGTGKVATPEDAQEVCGAIRQHLSWESSEQTGDGIRILYGGSVKATTVRDLVEQPDVDGALIGGASLDVDEFVAICKFAQPVAEPIA